MLCLHVDPKNKFINFADAEVLFKMFSNGLPMGSEMVRICTELFIFPNIHYVDICVS